MINQLLAKRIHAEFFRASSGNEPVRDKLKALGWPANTKVGEDIRFVELNWRVDRPYIDRLRSGHGEFQETLYEVRHTVNSREFRTLFFVYDARMILVHFFQKKSMKTPLCEIEVAWTRMKRWVAEQKQLEVLNRKRKEGK